MGMKAYMTFGEYQELGGTVEEKQFRTLLRKAQNWLDYFTFNRMRYLTIIPDVVKEVLTEYVDRLYLYDSQREHGDMVSHYSNGVESFTYDLKTEKQTRRELFTIAKNWLPNEYLCRSIAFDAEQYIQPESHHPKQV